MNRRERRAHRRAMGRGSSLTPYECERCGERVLHVELWVGDDRAHGLPEGLCRCECGGSYVAVSSEREGST
jgi:hypothetical protein